MEITEVRVKLMNDKDEKLRAFCSVTFSDDFVVRDLKIIGGTKGPFVAMPSRKLMDRCPRCGGKNHLRSRFCNDCGIKLDPNRAGKDRRGRSKLHTDIAHPINSHCREMIQARILEAYKEESIRASQPDYQPPSFDDYDDLSDDYTSVTNIPPRKAKWEDEEKREKQEEKEEKRQEKENSNRGDDSFDAGIFS